jgi:broad specificity phosphatase PhoE
MNTITLIRHGRSAHGRAFEATALRDLGDVLRNYDAVGIAADCVPPAEAVACIGAAGRVVCSPLRRSSESAQWLLDAANVGGGDSVRVDPTFREVDLPEPPGLRCGVAMHPAWWVACLRMLWLLRLHGGNIESPRRVWKRASKAANRLAVLARSHGHVVLVGHCLLNYLIAWILVRRGWQGKPRFQGYWEQMTFNKE